MNRKVYHYIIQLGLALVFIFSPLLLGAKGLWSITPIKLVVLLLVFLWFWRMNNERGWNFRPTALDLPIWTFIALASISCIFTIYLHDSVYEMTRLIMVVGVYYLIVNNFDRKAIERFTALIVIMGAAMALFGLTQYFLKIPHTWWSAEELLSSTYTNHNHFAGYLEMAIPLSLGLFFSEKSFLRKLMPGCAAVVMAAAFILAQSRGAWVSIAIAVIIATFYFSKKGIISKYALLIVLLSLILFFVVIYSGEDDIARRVETMADVGGDTSLLTRVKIWRGTVEMIRNNPVIGTGIGTFVWGFPRYRPAGLNYKIVHAHNDYLHMTAEMGLLALPLICWMVFIVIRKGLSLSTQPIYAGVTVGLLSIFLHGLIDFNFHIPANMILVSALCALVMIADSGE